MTLAAAVPVDAPIYLADHPLLFAIPFLIPVAIIVLVIGGIVWRDRRSGELEDEPSE